VSQPFFTRARAEHPAKRATERLWLLYTPVWGAVCGVVMLGGFAEHWGDAALLCLGIAVALPALLGPMLLDRATIPFAERTGVKLSLSVTAFSLLLNYTQTPFFFDVLHAHFGFHSSWNIRNNPIFLYLMTIPYFATYSALLLGAHRLLRRSLAGTVAACFVIALLEALCNANPFTRHLYCFDDYSFALWFGSLAYGLAFVCILPVWLAIDEHPNVSLTLRYALVGVLAAVYADSLLLDVLRYHVAPQLTTVREGANGMDRSQPSCLDAP
jgi:cycloeucalenol cycloisomerase